MTGPVAAFTMLVLAVIFVWYGARSCHRDMKQQELRDKEWTRVAEGVYDHVSYGFDSYQVSTRHGSMVHTTSTHSVRYDVTVIYFIDGSTYVHDGRYSIRFPSGLYIVIWENGNKKLRIEAT